MEWIFFGAFSILAAILFNFANPKVMAQSWAQTPGASSYIGKTLVTGLSFFIVLAAAGFLISMVKSSAATPPTA